MLLLLSTLHDRMGHLLARNLNTSTTCIIIMETYSMEPVLRDHMQPSILNSFVFPAVVPHSSLVDVVGH